MKYHIGLQSSLPHFFHPRKCNIFVIVLSYIFGIILNLGVNGVLIGFIMGLTVGSVISFIIFELFIKKIKETNMFLS